MAGDSWRLARDAQPGRPDDKRLSEALTLTLTLALTLTLTLP